MNGQQVLTCTPLTENELRIVCCLFASCWPVPVRVIAPDIGVELPDTEHAIATLIERDIVQQEPDSEDFPRYELTSAGEAMVRRMAP